MSNFVPTPEQSPRMAAHRLDRHNSNSPALAAEQQQLSKRDKRRYFVAQRLADVSSNFLDNRDSHYREQLQSLQIDMNLIMNADAGGDMPLPDTSAEIDALVRKNLDTLRKILGSQIPPRAGQVYSEFAKSINDAMEDRDTTLTMLKRDTEVKAAQIDANYIYREKLSSNENAALTSTLLDRLINSVTSKKNRLAKEKESLELSDHSNALHLFPAQFGIANPASPGGLHGKRATRHRRDVDELPNFPQSNKRKRNAAHDSDESPAPARQRIDKGPSTPQWFAERDQLKAVQIESSLYSVEKLFTEKELSLSYNNAALASHLYMQRHKKAESDDSPSNGKSDSSSENEKVIPTTAEPEDAESPPGGTAMERQFSHATRSTRGAGHYISGLGIDALSDINHPATFDGLVKQIPKLPPLGMAWGSKNYSNKDPSSSGPAPPMTPEDANSEVELIKKNRAYSEANGYGSNLVEGSAQWSLLREASNKSHRWWVESEKVKVQVSSVRDE